MSILSDGEIREFIAKNELIIDGEIGNAKQCAYHCFPGKVFHSGPEGAVVDWSKPNAPEFVKILPGAMVWIRTRVVVKMPSNICAFWWQTNTLSRKGLMLVNMSMIEPGYHGPLACLFVNFGKTPITLYPDTNMAKLVFMRMSKPADTPLGLTLSVDQYDKAVHEAATEGPESFLQVADFSKQLVLDRDAAIEDIKKAAENEKNAQVDQLKDDAPKAIRSSLGWAAFGFVLLVAAVTFVPWVQGLISPDLDDTIRSTVEKAVTERLVLQAAPQVENTQATPGEVPAPSDDLETRLREVEQRLLELQRASDNQ